MIQMFISDVSSKNKTNQLKNDKIGVSSQGVDQHFQTFSCVGQKITEKCVKSSKKVENGQKIFQPAFSCAQHPKVGGNTQQFNI